MISNLVSWTVPFLLGLFSSFLIDNIRNHRKNKRNKEFIQYYLKNTIQPVLSKLESSYEEIKSKISTFERSFFTQPAFEDFNTNILNGITPVDYYKIFKDKYVVLNEIITMIEYLSENLPNTIYLSFYNFIDNHLKEINEVGNREHVQSCPDCLKRQSEMTKVLDLRIEEVILLKSKIEEIIE